MEISLACIDKIESLTKQLKGLGKIALAFSGGVDSTFLLALAKQAGPEKLLAITVVSQFFTKEENLLAKKMADAMGVAHICLDLDILGETRVVRNTPQRCYFCKTKIFSLVRKTAIKQGIDTFLHAVNVDDLVDYRPGLEAAKELGFMAPLVDAGFLKKEIRDCSRQMGLETWNLPSESCLATRIPYNDPITQEKLGMIAQGESFLRKMGFNNFRVRCHGHVARIEMDPGAFSFLMDENRRRTISQGLKKIGFEYVACDLDGYKTGNMNKFKGE